jgi:hypothetical protein
MILTDYLKGDKLTEAKSRYDITASSESYDFLESLLINKRGFNVGGTSFNCVTRPDRWRKKNASLAICKGSHNITSLIRPDVNLPFAIGDINGTKDAAVFVFNPDHKKTGIKTIEVFIGRGLKNDFNSLWDLLIDGDLNPEMEILRQKAVTKNVTRQMEMSGV